MFQEAVWGGIPQNLLALKIIPETTDSCYIFWKSLLLVFQEAFNCSLCKAAYYNKICLPETTDSCYIWFSPKLQWNHCLNIIISFLESLDLFTKWHQFVNFQRLNIVTRSLIHTMFLQTKALAKWSFCASKPSHGTCKQIGVHVKYYPGITCSKQHVNLVIWTWIFI